VAKLLEANKKFSLKTKAITSTQCCITKSFFFDQNQPQFSAFCKQDWEKPLDSQNVEIMALEQKSFIISIRMRNYRQKKRLIQIKPP
jgi:hypothetical protein